MNGIKISNYKFKWILGNISNENFRREELGKVVVDNLEGLIKDNWSYVFVCMMLGLKNKLNSQFNPFFRFFFILKNHQILHCTDSVA